MVFSETDSDDDGGIASLFQRPYRESFLYLIAPVKRLFTWDGVDRLMELDTVSPVYVIPKRIHEENKASWPQLLDTSLSHSCYLGKVGS